MPVIPSDADIEKMIDEIGEKIVINKQRSEYTPLFVSNSIEFYKRKN